MWEGNTNFQSATALHDRREGLGEQRGQQLLVLEVNRNMANGWNNIEACDEVNRTPRACWTPPGTRIVGKNDATAVWTE